MLSGLGGSCHSDAGVEIPVIAAAVAVREPVVELGVEVEKEALANHIEDPLEVVELDNFSRRRVEVDRHRVGFVAVGAGDFAPVVSDGDEEPASGGCGAVECPAGAAGDIDGVAGGPCLGGGCVERLGGLARALAL